MLSLILTVSILGNHPPEFRPCTIVDEVEINTKIGENTGKKVFTQIIFWEVLPTGKRKVIKWQIGYEHECIIVPTFPSGCEIVKVSDKGVPLRFIAISYIHSRTFTDPEVDNRKPYPIHTRRKLVGW
mgnify:FL=1